jgi:hypothetical protein
VLAALANDSHEYPGYASVPHTQGLIAQNAQLRYRPVSR